MFFERGSFGVGLFDDGDGRDRHWGRFFHGLLCAGFKLECRHRGRGRQGDAEIGTVLFGEMDGFGQQFPEAGLDGLFGFGAQFPALLFPLEVFDDWISHESFILR